MHELVRKFFTAIQNSPPAVAGLLSGILGAFVADWFKWGFERRRDRREARRRLIEQARNPLAVPPPKADFRETSLFFQLSPHLPAATRAKMTSTLLSKGGEGVEVERRGNRAVINPYADIILRDLVALERKLGLI